MTIPAMMNCQHSADGWCLDCVKVLDAQLAAAQERVRVLHESLRDMAQSWRDLADGLGTAPYHDGKRDALRECADDLARTFDAALAGTEPTKE